MNWEEIKEKYPKAYQKFHEYYYGDCAYKEGEHPPIVLMNLQRSFNSSYGFEFFDNCGIIITLQYRIIGKSRDFLPIIHLNVGNPEHLTDDNYSNRLTAEHAAFTRAFKILEADLQNG